MLREGEAVFLREDLGRLSFIFYFKIYRSSLEVAKLCTKAVAYERAAI